MRIAAAETSMGSVLWNYLLPHNGRATWFHLIVLHSTAKHICATKNLIFLPCKEETLNCANDYKARQQSKGIRGNIK